KTGAKKGCLLMVLTHPEIPLHNNPAELGARARVRKRDVSFGPRTREGAKAWDTFMTLAETATKLGVSFYHYIYDRVSGLHQLPALADTIEERAKSLNLGASWNTSYLCLILLRRYRRICSTNGLGQLGLEVRNTSGRVCSDPDLLTIGLDLLRIF